MHCNVFRGPLGALFFYAKSGAQCEHRLLVLIFAGKACDGNGFGLAVVGGHELEICQNEANHDDDMAVKHC